jgi:hypothetical protein
MRQVTGKTGKSYRQQLDRVRRFLNRLENRHRSDVDYQDDMWAFFQNCWHLKDWVKHCEILPDDKKTAIKELVHRNTTILICRDLANGTKHLLDDKNLKAQHKVTNVTITPGEGTVVDCVIVMRNGTRRSGYELAHECVKAWEAIFTRVGVSYRRLS